ncbi:MAG: alpha/beta fold hydrolase [Bacillota bacterium]|nr:alpha/beta fold hydrolase [Bacillota bacterium]
MSIFRSYTPAFKDNCGRVMNNSIAEMRMITIGNTRQWVLIRGENRNNPVLLILHGGPGSPESCLFRYYNHSLEKNFVVVNWDQRACGKSYCKATANEPLNIKMFVEDTLELTKALISEFHKEKIFILGHSWGTFIGLLAASRHPELYYAYVGTGQVSNMPEGELVSYDFALNAAVKSHNQKAIQELEKIGKPKNGVYECGSVGTKTERKWLSYFGGSVYGKKSFSSLMTKFLTSKEYNIVDIIHMLKGMNTPARTRMSQGEFLKTDLTKIVNSLDIPVYFFLGRHDFQIPSKVAEKYFQVLKAPLKKFVWFENSAHTPCFEEPEKFNDLLVNMVLADSIKKANPSAM